MIVFAAHIFRFIALFTDTLLLVIISFSLIMLSTKSLSLIAENFLMMVFLLNCMSYKYFILSKIVFNKHFEQKG